MAYGMNYPMARIAPGYYGKNVQVHLHPFPPPSTGLARLASQPTSRRPSLFLSDVMLTIKASLQRPYEGPFRVIEPGMKDPQTGHWKKNRDYHSRGLSMIATDCPKCVLMFLGLPGL